MSRLTTSRRPNVEALESRWCPTGVSFANGTLTVTGDDTANTLSIRQDDATNTLRVDVDVQIGGNKFLIPHFFASDAVKSIKFDLKGGNDVFIYKLDSDASHAKSLFGDLGYGDDKATLKFDPAHVKADLAFVLLGDPFSLDPHQPEHGSDTLVATIGEVDSATLEITAVLGGGANDIADVHLYGDLKGTADVNLGIFGSAGHDLIMVTTEGYPTREGSKGIHIDPNARLDVWLDGDGKFDEIVFKYTGDNDGRIGYHVDAGGDAGDIETVSILQSAGSTGKVVVV